MADNKLQRWFEAVNAQIAAEAFLGSVFGVLDPSARELAFGQSLQLGNLNNSRFPFQEQLTPSTFTSGFSSRYELIAYQDLSLSQNNGTFNGYGTGPNPALNKSGFAAVLLKDKSVAAGNSPYVLAVRSTEFSGSRTDPTSIMDPGDYYAGLEIGLFGASIGQVASLDQFFGAACSGSIGENGQADSAKLTEFAGYMAAGGRVDLTGYSLGGEVATLFANLRSNSIQKVTLINSAGLGTPDGIVGVPLLAQYQSGIAAAYARFQAALADPLGYVNSLSASQWSALERATLRTGVGRIALGVVGRLVDSEVSYKVYDKRATVGSKSLVDTLLGFIQSGTRATPSDRDHGIYDDPVYLLAAIAATTGWKSAWSTSDILFGRSAPAERPRIVDERVSDLFGYSSIFTDLSGIVISRSGLRSGERLPIYIEEQDRWRFPENLFNSEVDYDFGDGHSIVLLGDSLALMAAFERLAPNVTETTLAEVFERGSNKRYDSLERGLDALRRLVQDLDVSPSAQGTSAGSLPGDFAKMQYRGPYYDNLLALTSDARFASQAGRLTIESLGGRSANQLEEDANDTDRGLATRYSLRELNPFVALGADYSMHNGSGTLEFLNSSSGIGQITVQWTRARAEMLAAKSERNLNDTILTYKGGNENWRYEDYRLGEKVFVVGSEFQAILLPKSAERKVELFLARGATHRVLFDADQDPTAGEDSPAGGVLSGGKYDDFLFGGGGNDFLNGFDGADYLEGGNDQDYLFGGTGNDTLAGGKGESDRLNGGVGRDTYIWSIGDGTDVIVDTVETSGADVGMRAGRIAFAGAEDLSGVKTLVSIDDDKLFRDVAENRYRLFGEHGSDGTLVITAATGVGGLRIVGFKDGDFGIILNPAGYQPTPVTEVQGTFDDDNNFSVDDPHNFTLFVFDPDQRMLGLDGDDRIKVYGANSIAMGGLGDDVLLNGPNDQLLFGEEGDDILLASAGDDELDGGIGDDVLQGGIGDDYLDGGPEDATVVSSTESDHDLIDGGPGSDVIIGGDGNDLLVGGGNLVPTAHVLGYDHTIYSYGYKRQLDGRMRIENIAGYKIEYLDPFIEFESWPYVADGYFNVDGDLADFIDGGRGDDFVLAGDGDDVVLGGSGADLLVGQVGDDYVQGGTGDDTLMGDGSRDNLVYDGGVNIVYAFGQYHGADTLFGDEGNDVLYGDGGADELYGGDGNDELVGDASADKLEVAYHGDDYLDGGAGEDVLFGYGGDDVLFGGEANDELYGDGTLEAVPFANHGDDYLDGEGGDDTLVGGGGSDQLFGGDGSDTLAGDADDVSAENHGADYLDGELGDDRLQGYGGDDTLIAGRGDDTLAGGKGDDRYLVELGDGDDTIIDGSGTNAVAFGEGITAADLTLAQGLDPQGLGYLVINYSASDSLAIQGGFNGIQLFEFSDGKTLSPFTLYRMLASASTLPTVSGGGGNDTLPTGPLSQVVLGGSGDDTYAVSRSSGWSRVSDQTGASDRIVFDASVSPEHARFLRRANGDLEVEVLDAEDPLSVSTRVSLIGQFLGGENRIETFEFDDGTLVQANDLDTLPLAELEGTAADDELVGDLFTGQTFSAGEGTDTLAGGFGDDVYRYAKGDGSDVVTDSGGIDRIEFAAGVAREDVLVERRTNEDLVLTLDDGGSITFTGQFLDPSNPGIDEIRFSDGTTIDAAQLASTPVTPEFGTEEADTIDGGQSDDMLYGFGGDDVMEGGGGADTIVAGAGNDDLIGGAGDDLMAGEDGADSYRLGYGTGRDTLVDDSPQTNRLVLNPGIAFGSLRTTRTGDDLEIAIRGASDGVLLAGYFASQQSWSVEDSAGDARTPEALFAETEALEQDQRNALKLEYIAVAKANFTSGLLSQGYDVVGDGILANDVYSPAYAHFTVADQATERTTTPVNGTPSTTNWTDHFSSWNTIISSGFSNHDISQFQTVTVTSDDAFIDSPEITRVVSPDVVTSEWVQAQWTTISQTAPVQANYTNVGTITYTDPNTGQLVLLATYVDHIQHISYVGDKRGDLSPVPEGVTPYQSPFGTFNPPFRTVAAHHVTRTDTLYSVEAGAGDNTIVGGAIVDAGAGDDIVFSNGLVFGGDGNDQLTGAGSLYGDAGDDVLFGAGSVLMDGGSGNDTLYGGGSILIGGEGSDLLQGEAGVDWYVVRASEAGDDLVFDNGAFNSNSYFLWYYQQLGFEDPLAYLESGGTLPPLSYPGALDFGALQPLYDLGIVDSDVVEFADGILLSGIELSWGVGIVDAGSGIGLAPRRTLAIDIGAGQRVRVAIPNAEDAIGLGVERFQFDSDGVILTLEELLSLAPPMPAEPVNVILGTELDDVLFGTLQSDEIQVLGGNDRISAGAGNDVLRGGDGSDTLDGESGSDRFAIASGELGTDVIADSGADSVAYLEWYYGNRGIFDWRERGLHAGQFRVRVFGDGDEGSINFQYFDTYEEAENASSSGQIVQIQALTDFAPVITRNDAAAIEALTDAGVITRDVIEVGPGIALADLELTVTVSGVLAESHPEQPWYGGGTLSVRWSDGGFDVDVPDVKFGLTGSNLLTDANANDGDWMQWGDYRLGEGMEAMEFADGSSYSLEALLQFATVNLIYGYEFLRDSGYQLIEGYFTGVDFGPDIAPSDIYAFRSGTNLYFGVISDSALGLIPGWYASPAAIPDWEFRFDDGTVLDADAVTRLGLTQNGDSSTNFLFADPDFSSALIGHGDSDYLTGGDGNDLLDGGTENDSLTGGGGNDIYLFGAGYGVDMVNEATNGTGIDTVRFDASVAPGSVFVAREFDMLILTAGGGGDAVWLPSWFDESGGRVEAFEFADGTTWNAAAVEAQLPVMAATAGDDLVLGATSADVLDGLEGNDEMHGFAGNDTLRGGPGDDFLVGGGGDDTYFFQPGDGADYLSDRSGNNVLQFGDGIDPQSVRVTRDDSSMYVVVGGTGERVVLLDWFYEGQPQISQVAFSDGTTWNATELVSRISLVPATGFDDVLWGTDGADVVDALAGEDQIFGNEGSDILRGGAGDDSFNEVLDGGNLLEGGEGSDYFYQEGRSIVIGGAGDDWVDVYGSDSVVAFNPGDGADTVYVTDAFTLSIGGGIGAQDLSLSPDGDDIVLAVGGADSVRLSLQWEANPQAWPAITLQLFGSVHTYDFTAVLGEFYTALAANPSLTEFALGTVLPGHQIASSETDAFGGAMAHQYGTLGTTGGLANAQILSGLQDPNFGAARQSISVAGGNSSPVLVNPMADVAANEDAAFAHAISGDAFSDPDAADTLTYSATLGDGSTLPAWLSFDAETRSFSGTPLQADVGTTDIKVTASDGGGLSAEDTFTLTVANVNDAPIVSAADGQLLLNDSILAAALFSIFDEDGQSPTQYQFWDDVAGGGHFEVNGIEQGAAAAIAVSAADLANTEYLAGTAPGTERVWARAYDDAAWSAWKSWNMTSALHIPNAAPEATPTAATQTVLLGQSLDASSLFSVLDADGDPAVRFEFWDSTAGNGHFTVNGVEQAVDAAIAVSSEDLADTAFVGASEAGSDLVWVRATDGQSFGAWKNWTMNSWPHATNAAPVADAANGEVLRDQAVFAQSLFSVTDVDGDAIAQYEFWDDTAGGGYFDVAGVAQLNNPIPISAAQLADVTYVGGADPGTEQVWVRANDGMQWGAWESWNMTTALHIPNAAPEATPTAATQTVLLAATVNASALFSITDADSDPVARYEFWDSTTGIGHFAVGGVEQGVNIAIAVDAADLTGTQFVGGASTGYDLVWVRASDGQTWSDWKSWTMNSWPHASNAAPVVTAVDTTLLTSEVVTADSLFDVSDADGDATAQYEFWDDVNGGGYWRVNGVQQGAAQTIAVAAGDLAGTDYVGGASGGTERVWVRASDGLAWSAWKPWNITTALHIPNAAPVVTASDSTLLLGQSIDAGSLFSVTDGDSDPITQYEFWDSTNGGGHFTVNGVEQGVNVAIAVTAAQLVDTDFAGANATASDLVWVRANDGQTWSAWKSWTVNSWPHLTNSAPVVSAQTGGVLRSEAIPAAMLFGVSDADGDAMAKYEFWDDVNGGGRFEVNGVQQAAGQSIAVAATDLANTTYVGGVSAGTEQVWVRANDGLAWGAWRNWLMSTEGGMLRGGSGPDTLNGDAGPTALEGGGGNDTLTDLDGDNLFSGGEGDDAMTGGDGDDLFAGGSGNDTINTGAGSNIIAYNAGGGVDTVVAAAGAANTLSFGGGIGYDDLSLSKDGNDLIVSAGVNDRVVLKDWYAGSNNVLDLQIILDATQEFDANSSDPLYNRKVQNFNFAGLVGEFDAALAQSPGLTSWAMTNALLQFHLSGADDAALGGDLAYWYGKNGGFTGISLQSAQQVIGAQGFGSEAQTLRPFSGLQEGLVKLA